MMAGETENNVEKGRGNHKKDGGKRYMKGLSKKPKEIDMKIEEKKYWTEKNKMQRGE